ncbi:MAG TPA: c-type cytochrome [Bellilinea sp.]
MKRSIYILIAVFALSTLLLAACGGGGTTSEEPEPPAPYKGMTNPLAGNADAATAGGVLFTERCASCHGPAGAGDGPAAAALTPPPADLKTEAPDLTDDFIFWRIMDGGAMDPWNSSMPAQKGILTDDQVWQLVTFIRSITQ